MLGEEPTKAWGDEDVRNRYDSPLFGPWINQVLIFHSTLGRAYTELINSFSESAQDHVNLADGLDAQVVNALKLVEKRHDEAKKKVLVPGQLLAQCLTSDVLLASKSFPKASL